MSQTHSGFEAVDLGDTYFGIHYTYLTHIQAAMQIIKVIIATLKEEHAGQNTQKQHQPKKHPKVPCI